MSKQPSDPGRTARRKQLRRIFYIHNELQNKKYPNCTTLARVLHCSTKVIQDAIAFMMDDLEFPMDYDSRNMAIFIIAHGISRASTSPKKKSGR